MALLNLDAAFIGFLFEKFFFKHLFEKLFFLRGFPFGRHRFIGKGLLALFHVAFPVLLELG
ncbi:hypothetical protein D3C83_166000 [compost metagenome]